MLHNEVKRICKKFIKGHFTYGLYSPMIIVRSVYAADPCMVVEIRIRIKSRNWYAYIQVMQQGLYQLHVVYALPKILQRSSLPT
jgi:hypothetical protein